MNKKFVLFLSLVGVFLFYGFHLDIILQKKLLKVQTSLSSSYVAIVTKIKDISQIYFTQVSTIKKLKNENHDLLKYKVLYTIAENNLKDINSTISSDIVTRLKNINLSAISVLQYYKFNNISKVIFDKQSNGINSIEALITYDGYSAGIVLNKEINKIGYLNNDKKCNYAVNIGKENAPAITSGMTSNGELILQYIPLWKKIAKGDIVITSGMDNIFPYGIKVGKIIKIEKDKTTQTAYAKPFAQVVGIRKFLIVK